jgi:hypothetical protein
MQSPKQMTKILVGTLYTIENEYDSCLTALHRQKFQGFDHFVIQGLPNREAHDQLYRRFMDHAQEYDLFIKLDADMILIDEQLFGSVVDRFERHATMELFTILVLDFFTGRLINGLHTFRNTVEWAPRADDVFTDAHSVPRGHMMVDDTDLAPAAYHCKNPSDFQAFHYGLHRGVKVRETRKLPRRQLVQLVTRLQEILDIWNRYRQLEDRRLGLASLGAELGLRGDFTPDHIDYTNPYALQVYEDKYANWDGETLHDYVRSLRLRNRLEMPSLEVLRLSRRALGPLRPYLLELFE